MQYYESPVYGQWCKNVYGNDLKQMGMVTMDELELFYRELDLSPDSRILDMGCGPGYISAVIAEHFKSYVTGVDIDEGSISHAKKTISNNPMLSFLLSDGCEVSFEAYSFDLIYFFDTLYFTGSIEKLRKLLDKCLIMLKPGGKLAVFWSNHPDMYEMSEPAPCNTQVGIWGIDNDVRFKAFDLTEAYRKFWLKAMEETLTMESELRNEIPETYKQLMDECSRFSELCAAGDSGGMFRWLYIFTR